MIQFTFPFHNSYPITQRFGERITDPNGHSGVDFALPKGTNVRAAAAGIIKAVHWSQRGYGIHILIDHGGGIESLYAHLLTTSFPVGTAVEPGQIIAMSGSSGNSTGPHLHFEIRRDGKAVDPLPLIQGAEEKVDPGAARKWVVSVDQLNVRSGPSLAYAVVRRLNRGEMFGEFTRRESTWIRIGINEWVAAQYMNEQNAKILADGAAPAIRKGSFRKTQ